MPNDEDQGWLVCRELDAALILAVMTTALEDWAVKRDAADDQLAYERCVSRAARLDRVQQALFRAMTDDES